MNLNSQIELPWNIEKFIFIWATTSLHYDHYSRAWKGIMDLVLAENLCMLCMGEVCACMHEWAVRMSARRLVWSGVIRVKCPGARYYLIFKILPMLMKTGFCWWEILFKMAGGWPTFIKLLNGSSEWKKVRKQWARFSLFLDFLGPSRYQVKDMSKFLPFKLFIV